MLDEYKKVKLKGKLYCVLKIKFKDTLELGVIDEEDLDKVLDIAKWNYSTAGGYVHTNIYIKDDDGVKHRKKLYLHNFIMGKLDFPGKGTKKSVDHINRIGLDNRKANLRLISQTKQNYNKKKVRRKEQIVNNDGDIVDHYPELTENGITKNDIPTNVWYRKARGYEGSCFMIQIKKGGKKKTFYTTKSKKKTIKEKFEIMKEKVKELKNMYPDLFEKRCRDGELFNNGNKLLNEYKQIINKSGLSHFV